MARFNPFARASSKYGAPMGRHGHDADSWDGHGKLYVRHCGGDGYYDRGGAYWGHSNVYAVWTRGGGFCAYVEANSEGEALRIVMNGPLPDGFTVKIGHVGCVELWRDGDVYPYGGWYPSKFPKLVESAWSLSNAKSSA